MPRRSPRTTRSLLQPTRYPLGLPGCRAPGGSFRFIVPDWAPSKSNQYKIIDRRDTGAKGLAVSAQMASFNTRMEYAVLEALRAIHYHVDWFLPPRRRREKALNPLFGFDIEFDVSVSPHEYFRTNRDTDGVLKALCDVGKRTGLFVDDVQVGNLHVWRRSCVHQYPDEFTILELTAVATPSWAGNPNGRPVNTATARRWLAAAFPPAAYPEYPAHPLAPLAPMEEALVP